MLILVLLVCFVLLALPLSLVGALLHNPLVVQRRANRYLTRHYPGTFTILQVERIYSGAGPIPVFRPVYHWKLTVRPDQCPEDVFVLRYVRDKRKKWRWREEYFTHLLEKNGEVLRAQIDWNQFPQKEEENSRLLS